MRVLMFGWEFPPHLSGGLGTACYGMTKALASKGVDIRFVLPRLGGAAPDMPRRLQLCSASGVTMRMTPQDYQAILGRLGEAGQGRLVPEAWRNWSGSVMRAFWEKHLHIEPLDSALFPYATGQSYAEVLNAGDFSRRIREEGWAWASMPRGAHDGPMVEDTINLHGGYGPDLMTEVFRYSQAAVQLAGSSDFDLIHAHDWMTYPAGMAVKAATGKPLIVHIHALESDRSGMNMNTEVASIEKAGMEAADVVVAVSHYTKSRVVRLYGIPPEKIRVVHNAVTRSQARSQLSVPQTSEEKRVLFMGRITYQKGPEYFVEAANLVLKHMKNVRFIMAGSGDMLSRMVGQVARLRLGSHFHFTGFLKGENVDRMYAMSDLYVMPSVSEPFGIAPLEAMAYDVPVIISQQSGVSEVVRHALKVNFWDVRDMADKICAVLRYPKLADELVRNCREELKNIRWENSADRLIRIYERCIEKHAGGGC